MEEKDTKSETPQVNPGYAFFQIAKALRTCKEHQDTATSERARQKVAKWVTVINGILSGELDVGSRTPVEGIPAWATLEVVTGGFATGELLAAGPLLPHEQALLGRLPAAPKAQPRQQLNGYYLSDNGLAELQERVRSGCYDIDIPEEGALLVVAWLVQHEFVEEARALLDTLAPYFGKLRFYPVPRESPQHFGARVFVQDVRTSVEGLRKLEPKKLILAQKEAVEIWVPLYDKVVALFLETVAGDVPRLRQGPDGRRIPRDGGKFPIEGGWPCQEYPEGWTDRAGEILAEYQRKRQEHRLCGKPERNKESFPQLREYLRQCIRDPSSLTGRDVGRVRLILARYISKRGAPGSHSQQEVRKRQRLQTRGPTFYELAKVLIQRLEAYPQDYGLDDLEAAVQPITDGESQQSGIDAESSIPVSLRAKVQRSLTETVEVLVERGIITSGETLARVLPQMTSGLRAAGITDRQLREIYAATYRAFRRRRSLLLLNLESQVKIEELPWIAAIDRFRSEDLSTRELAQQTLQDIVILVVSSFPYAILPNKLLQELRALATAAKLNLPLVDEVAADIFMGAFSVKFLQAARRAADLLEGTLYARYYGIDFGNIRTLPEVATKKRRGFWRRIPDSFVELCSSRAGVKYGTWDPATNGMIIEQQQILTTQNLAVLFDGLDLVDTLKDRLENLARCCFTWICWRLQIKVDNWHANLIMLKNSAYAWRQMVFFLAMLSEGEIQSFLVWAEDYLNSQGSGFSSRFRPALHGLVLAAQGRLPDEDAAIPDGARRFLGWSKERHWLLDH